MGAGDRALVTIGIPVYNGEDHLAEAIRSALMQDYPHLEVIILDNHSSDRTAAIAQEYARTDCRVRHERNSHTVDVAENFRRVLAWARGEYFTWLAHDDVLSSSRYVSTVTEFLERHSDVVLCGSSVHVLDVEGPGTVSPTNLEAIHPDRAWGEARAEFFRYPYRDLHRKHIYHAFYGMYRRAALAGVRLVTWQPGDARSRH